MIRDIDLLSYLPPFIQEYREMKEIMKTENPEFQSTADESEIILNNQFITTSNLDGIARFEKLLNITPSSDDNLQSRISRVLTRWNDVVPYTYKALIEKLTVLSDGLDFTINNDFNNYKMEIITHLELAGQVDELQNLLGYMIPVNLDITSKNEIYCNSYGQGKLASGMAFCSTFELSNDYEVNFEINGQSKTSGTYIGTASVTISDNFNEEIEAYGENNLASNVSYTSMNGID